MTRSARLDRPAVQVRIANVRDGGEGEYVGRRAPGRKESPLANPFRSYDKDDAAEREHVIDAYRTWLGVARSGGAGLPYMHRVEAELERLRALASRPEGVTLLCWCAPLACHAEVIRDVLTSEVSA